MPTAPDDRFEQPEGFGPGSVWADRVSERSLVGRNQRGVEIPIGHGEGETRHKDFAGQVLVHLLQITHRLGILGSQ